MSTFDVESGVSRRTVFVDSETARLRSVIVGLPDSFVLPEPINPKQEQYHAAHPERPTRARLKPEFAALRAALEERDVEVIQPVPVAGVPDQLTPRDIGMVIGDVFVVASMATECRREEWRGIAAVLEQIPEDKIVRAPAELVLEGGDVILDRGTLFVGLSERTTRAGVDFLHDRFSGRYEVVPVPLKRLRHGEDVLHLDCTFLPVGSHHALIYEEGFEEVPDGIREQYEWIPVSAEEQFNLATNVLSISPTVVITRDHAVRVNAALRDLGLEVIELRFDETPKSGGSFRCASLPILRDA